MSKYVNVEYNVSDVVREDPKKKRGWKPNNKNSEAKKVQNPSREEKQNIKPAEELPDQRRKTVIIPPTMITPEKKPVLTQQRPASESRRSNPANKLKTDSPWQFSPRGIDRDLALLQLDMKISKFRVDHPSPYDEPIQRMATAGTDREHHHVQNPKLDKSIHLRGRVDPKTCGKIVNHELPFHPMLKEAKELGIHTERWNVMTLQSDDPERLKPTSSQMQSKSHDDFDHTFNSHSREGTRRRHSVEIVKKNAL
jgi:hypothetical protein